MHSSRPPVVALQQHSEPDALKLQSHVSTEAGKTERSYLHQEDAKNDNLWDVTQLHPMPMWYQLDQSSKVVHGISLHELCKSVVRVNKEMSVFAKYDAEKGSALLLTPDHVEIAVNLFAQQTNNGPHENNNGHNIIVEVQRRAGDSVFFHRYSKCILLASSGEINYDRLMDILKPDVTLPQIMTYNHNNIQFNHNNHNHNHNHHPSNNDAWQESHPESELHSHANEALTITSTLLQKERHDAQSLGMEGLGIITDLTKTGAVAARLCSRAVLLNDSEHNNTAMALQSTVLATVRNWNLIDDDDDDDDTLHDHHTFMVNRALLVLSNSLHVLVAQHDQGSSREELESVYDLLQRESILPCLIDVLDNVQVRPHDALLSARCFVLLLQHYRFHDDDTEDDATTMLVDRLKPSVDKAHRYGMRLHADLARECDALLAFL